MARRWNKKEEIARKAELDDLYIRQNKSIREVAKILKIAEQSVFSRLKRLGIKTCPTKKRYHQNRRVDLVIPQNYSADLAEFFGIMLGDGNLSHFQTMVTLGNKELSYANYVKELMERIFKSHAKVVTRKTGYYDVYIGSVELTEWLQKEGLVFNKVKEQVGMPTWIVGQKEFMQRFLRGFFDTDGSIYQLRFGIQLSFKNYSHPLLQSLQSILKKLQYKPSTVSFHKIYLTKKLDIERFFREIDPANKKHWVRFEKLIIA